MRAWPRSVRVRLTLWYAAALGAILLAFAAGVYAFAREQLQTQLCQQLAHDCAAVTRQAETEPDELEELGDSAAVPVFAVRTAAGLLYQTTAWQRLRLAPDFDDGTAAPAERSIRAPDGRPYRVVLGPPFGPENKYRMAVAQDEQGVNRALAGLARTLLLAYPAALMLAVASGYVLAGRLLAPVGAMARKAETITAERLAERLPVEHPHDELGRLARVFNVTLGRLESSFERLRRFTADASHELRTPLTAMRSVGEVALRDDRDAAAYREAIGSMLEEVDRLTRLVESLLLLTRADSGTARLVREPLDLPALAAEVVEHLRPLSEEKTQSLSATLTPGTIVPGDRLMLRQALINLLHNAIRYTPAHGSVCVRVLSANGHALLEVSDNGPGIAATEHARIFERFYRIDPARPRALGGAGLGLAIAKWAVQANGGRIELDSAPGRGSTFRIVLPVRDDPRAKA
jgi:heavy metal sensor kinase